MVLRDGVQNFLRRITAGDAFGISREDRDIFFPSIRVLAALHLEQMISVRGETLFVLFEFRHPSGASFGATFADAIRKMLADLIRHKELRIFGPSIIALGEFDLFSAERLAVSGRSILLVGRAVSDMAVNDDERRAVR